MNSIVDFYNSSIGKKIVMSLTGLFLCSFLLEHVAGNSFLFFGEEAFNAYSAFMVGNPVIRFIEFGLFAALVFHPLVGLLLWLQNRKARPQEYKMYKLDENAELASRITMLSGTIILLFLIVHLRTFFVPLRFAEVKPSAFALVQEAFSSGWYCVFYLVALTLLAYHLKHGFQSAFQTLGLRTKRYAPVLDAVAFVFWFIVPLWYATMPLYFYFFNPIVPGPMAGGTP